MTRLTLFCIGRLPQKSPIWANLIRLYIAPQAPKIIIRDPLSYSLSELSFVQSPFSLLRLTDVSVYIYNKVKVNNQLSSIYL